MNKKIMISFIKPLIYLLGGILITFMIRAFMGQAIDIKRKSDISNGYVTNKEIVTHSGTVTKYKLYVTGEYTKSITDLTVEYQKIFNVSEDIYNSYNIGDYFDSQNPKALSLSEQNVRNE